MVKLRELRRTVPSLGPWSLAPSPAPPRPRPRPAASRFPPPEPASLGPRNQRPQASQPAFSAQRSAPARLPACRSGRHAYQEPQAKSSLVQLRREGVGLGFWASERAGGGAASVSQRGARKLQAAVGRCAAGDLPQGGPHSTSLSEPRVPTSVPPVKARCTRSLAPAVTRAERLEVHI